MAAPQRMSSTMTSNMSSTRQNAFSTQIKARIVTYKLGLGCGIVLGLIGASLLVAFGILYVKPYMSVKDMIKTSCITINTTVLDELVKCQCDDTSSCISSYPCVSVYINYTDSDGRLVSNATLYDSLDTFRLQDSVVQCSYHECEHSVQENIDAVKGFADDYGETFTTFDCYYKPNNTGYVLLDVLTTQDIIHAMLWPSLAFIAGAIILCIYVFDLGIRHSSTPSSGSPFNSLEKPWLRHIERNYEKVGTLSEYNGDLDEDNDATCVRA